MLSIILPAVLMLIWMNAEALSERVYAFLPNFFRKIRVRMESEFSNMPIEVTYPVVIKSVWTRLVVARFSSLKPFAILVFNLGKLLIKSFLFVHVSISVDLTSVVIVFVHNGLFSWLRQFTAFIGFNKWRFYAIND